MERCQSITSSLLHFPLDIWKPGGAPLWKGKECSSENLNLTPKGDLCRRCLSFIISLKDTTQNGIGSITSFSSREDPLGTCRPDSRNPEISRNQAWKQILNKSVSFNYYFLECTLNDILTAKNGDVSSSTPQVRPESLICTECSWKPGGGGTPIFKGWEMISQPLNIRVPPPPPGFQLRSVAPCQVTYSLNSDLSTQYLIAEMLYLEWIIERTFL